MIMRRLFLFAALALAGAAADAQTRVWSLPECIDYALEHNISVRQGTNNVESYEVALNTAERRYLPNLSASASENFSFGRGLTADNTYTNSNTTSTSLQLGGSMPVFDGMDIANGIRIARLDLEAATADLEKAKDDIRVQVAQAYAQILYNEELLSVARMQVEHDTFLLEQVKARVAAGKASRADISAQQATLSRSGLSATQAEGNLNISILELTQLLELDSPDGFEVLRPSVESFEPQLLMKPEEIYAQAEGIRPAVLSAQIRLDAAGIAISRAKGAYLPTLSINGGIGTNYYTTSKVEMAPLGDQLKNNFSQYVGLSLNIPIFDRFSTRNNVRTARINRDNSALQLESVKKSLYKEIQQAYYNAVASQARYRSSADAAASAREHYELTEEKYMGGKAGVSEYNDAKNSWLSAESDYLKARYECLYQTRLLDFYRGREIAF